MVLREQSNVLLISSTDALYSFCLCGSTSLCCFVCGVYSSALWIPSKKNECYVSPIVCVMQLWCFSIPCAEVWKVFCRCSQWGFPSFCLIPSHLGALCVCSCKHTGPTCSSSSSQNIQPFWLAWKKYLSLRNDHVFWVVCLFGHAMLQVFVFKKEKSDTFSDAIKTVMLAFSWS